MSRIVDLLSGSNALSSSHDQEEDLQSEDAAGSTSSEDAEGDALSDEGGQEAAVHVEEDQEDDGQPLRKRRKSEDSSAPVDALEDTTVVQAATWDSVALQSGSNDHEIAMDALPVSEVDLHATLPAPVLPERPQPEAASPSSEKSSAKKKKNLYVTPRELQGLFESQTSAPRPRDVASPPTSSVSTTAPAAVATSAFAYVPSRQAATKAANKIKASVPSDTVAIRQMEREALVRNGYDDATIAAWDRANPGMAALAMNQAASAPSKGKKPVAKKKAKSDSPATVVQDPAYSALAAIGITPTQISPVTQSFALNQEYVPHVSEGNIHESERKVPAASAKKSETVAKKKPALSKGTKASKAAKGKGSTGKSKAKTAGRSQLNDAYVPDVGTSRSAIVPDAPREPEKTYAQYVPQQEVEEEEDDRLYCVCQTLYDDERVMIACDLCDNWYHPGCVDIDDELVQLVESFICGICEPTTHKRTTFHTACARDDCMEATLPLSKYCSDWCGITVVAMRMAAQERKRGINLDLLWEAVSGLEKQQATIEAVDPADYRSAFGSRENDSRRIDHQMSTLRASLESTALKRTALEKQLASIDQRLQYLHSAIQRSEEFVAAHIAANPTASSKTKRSKTKTAAPAGAAGDAPCGFDVRLVWSDKDFDGWAETHAGRRALSLDEHDAGPAHEEEEGLVCMLPKRKCDRHTGWQKTKEADYEVEKAGLARRIDTFSDKERHLKRSIEDLRDTIRWREGRNGHRDGDDRTVGGADGDMDVEITPYVETFEIPPTPGIALPTACA